MKFSLKALFWLVTTVALLLAVAGYSYRLGMEAGRIKEVDRAVEAIELELETLFRQASQNAADMWELENESREADMERMKRYKQERAIESQE